MVGAAVNGRRLQQEIVLRRLQMILAGTVLAGVEVDGVGQRKRGADLRRLGQLEVTDITTIPPPPRSSPSATTTRTARGDCVTLCLL